ncbi:Interleukin-18 receptor accessory protein [Larimichthys crocea]|uniref:Interleukin-18 receptor accessory protein n=1 Tax=Larimichthys crocea TaxID=215358 RepID=A0A6G0J121_LARCR|nr:interleukin-18 receptor accessory protein [Larimichthys crocea]KAE8297469.1 Interleukin-18 receptor accessory protein [Larimichthys crocea]
MQAGYVVFFVFFPILLEGCCMGRSRRKKQTGHRQNITTYYYRAVEGEMFMMPCFKNENGVEEVVWSMTGEGREGNDRPCFHCQWKFLAEEKHSGKYTCLTRNLSFHLQVVKRSLECSQPKESSQLLFVGIGGGINCPGCICSNNTETNVTWYKGTTAVSTWNRSTCGKNGSLYFCKVDPRDTGLYFCDRQMIEQGIKLTVRRAVNVTVISCERRPPNITYPDVNKTEEVELGQSHTLTCEINFPFEAKFSPVVQWYMHYGGNIEDMTLLSMEKKDEKETPPRWVKVTQTAIIKKVTLQHLNNTYTCMASNTVGNSSVTIKLKKKIKANWPSLVRYPIVSLLVVSGLGIVLHVKWLELQLIYRSHFRHGQLDTEKKEFDVFLSYVCTSEEVEGVSKEACETTPKPLEVLLRQVLEDQWGYRLCLMERDVIPGVYTSDVVLAIQRSRMLICLLSAEYLSNNNAIFVLESGVQALLQKSALKLLLIWTNKAPAALIHPDLPTQVQRALKVLPRMYWTSGQPVRATSDFWKSLRKAMPDHRMKLVSLIKPQ